jgi:hypothetical protein
MGFNPGWKTSLVPVFPTGIANPGLKVGVTQLGLKPILKTKKNYLNPENLNCVA